MVYFVTDGISHFFICDLDCVRNAKDDSLASYLKCQDFCCNSAVRVQVSYEY